MSQLRAVEMQILAVNKSLINNNNAAIYWP